MNVPDVHTPFMVPSTMMTKLCSSSALLHIDASLLQVEDDLNASMAQTLFLR